MSDEEENDSDKTQIFLPGGSPLPATKPGEDDNKGVLLKAGAPDASASAPDTTAVDFDITSGAGFTTDQVADTATETAAGSTAKVAAAATVTHAAHSDSSSGSNGLMITIAIALVAVVLFFLFR